MLLQTLFNVIVEEIKKHGSLNCLANKYDYMTILKELNDGYVIKIVRDMDGYEEVKTDFLSKELFESCIRTGYLTEIEVPVEMAVIA